MKTKKIFSIITFVSVILTIFSVSFVFMRKLNSGKEIFNEVYQFSISADANNLVDSLNNCAIQSETVIPGLTTTQTEYLYNLETTLDKMVATEKHLTNKLLFDSTKTLANNKISNNYKLLKEKRSDLIHKMLIYRIKMSGNIYGDPLGTFSIMVEDVLDYLDFYADTIQLLNNYVYNIINLSAETTHNLISIHIDIIKNACNNFEYLTFNSSSYENLVDFNKRFRFTDQNNLAVNSSTVGGLYSIDAHNFNRYYSNCDKNVFATKFHELNSLIITPSTDKDYTHLAFYYLNKVVKEGV